MMEPSQPVASALPGQGPRIVLTHGGGGEGHESATHRVVAERIAALLGLPFGGACEEAGGLAASYLVPRNPLSGAGEAARYGIRGEGDLFGCWVPHAWMATKAIVHPLVATDAASPPGWSHVLAGEARGLTLDGFAAFSSVDALVAGRRLLRRGAVRIKPTGADGGRDQIVVRSEAGLASAVEDLCLDGELTDSLVLEEDLESVKTYSVGQVRLPSRTTSSRTISYCGTQSLTPNNDGAAAYGGSSLFVVRGGFDALLSCALPSESREAVEKAVAFDGLVDRHFAGLIASRRNYDVACGVDGEGRRRIGVLEQSWRVGGATPAEIAALEAFAANPRLQAVRARSVEVYGREPPVRDDATIYYRGEDPRMGPLTKYAWADEKI